VFTLWRKSLKARDVFNIEKKIVIQNALTYIDRHGVNQPLHSDVLQVAYL
jgi:hypothetical protein